MLADGRLFRCTTCALNRAPSLELGVGVIPKDLWIVVVQSGPLHAMP